ncbi:MAG: glycosyltransferase family 39 protein [Chloroflexi bacterium]|nr:glycosyltransferase family 39 protein [Chloroflexota bacterium]
MKYPLPATAGGYALRGPLAAVTSLTLSDAWRFVARHWGLLAALAITFAVHAPTLRYYFDGDDFVVLGSVQHLGSRQYLLDTLRMQDIVPNWRPLTGAVYTIEWNLFGLNAMAWRAVNLAVHLSSMAVLYGLVVRVTKRQAIGAVAALIFGVSGAHFDTVTYVTALPHLLATFFTLASLLAIVTYVQDGERNARAYWLSFILFGLGFLANEGAFVYAPVIVMAYALFARRWQRAPLRLVLHGLPFALLSGGWLVFYQTADLPQLKFDGFYWGSHVVDNYAVYVSFIVYPAKAIPLEPDTLRWVITGAFLASAAVLSVFAGNIVRVCLLGIGVALLPFVPVEIWTASRYTYGAVAFFAPIAAICAYWLFDRVRTTHNYVRVPATIVALVFVATVAGLYSWQTFARDRMSGERTDRWQLLVNELQKNYDTVPPGTTIYIVDGPWTNPMEQYTWVPSVARAVYGDAAAFDLPRSVYAADPPSTDNALFLQWTANGLQPMSQEQVRALLSGNETVTVR